MDSDSAVIDLSSLWSWILPLWGLFAAMLFLGGLYMGDVIIFAIPPIAPVQPAVEPPTSGGGNKKKQVRFSVS